MWLISKEKLVSFPLVFFLYVWQAWTSKLPLKMRLSSSTYCTFCHLQWMKESLRHNVMVWLLRLSYLMPCYPFLSGRLNKTCATSPCDLGDRLYVWEIIGPCMVSQDLQEMLHRCQYFVQIWGHYVRPSFTVSRLSRRNISCMVQPVYQCIECKFQLAATVNDTFEHVD